MEPKTVLLSGDYYLFLCDSGGTRLGQYTLEVKVTKVTGLAEPSVRTEHDVPGEFRLVQNYPNPFNPSTVMEYDVPRMSHVALTLYDIVGRVVSQPVDEVKEPGRYKLTLDGSRLASGVYLCVMRAGDFVGTVRLLLVK
jgi:hypothetical protein